MLFRLAILILHIALGSPQKMAECSSFFECMEKLRLRKMPSELFDEDFISSEVGSYAIYVICHTLFGVLLCP